MQCEVHQAQNRVLGAEHRDTLRTAGHLTNLLSEHMKHVEGLGGTAETRGAERVHAAGIPGRVSESIHSKCLN